MKLDFTYLPLYQEKTKDYTTTIEEIENHIEQFKQVIKRTPRPFPKLQLNELIKNKDFKDITEFTETELMEFWENGNFVRTVFLGA
jgi:thymidylate synthase